MIVGIVLRAALGALAGVGLGAAAITLLPPLLAPQDQALETRRAAALSEAPAQEVAPTALPEPEDVPSIEEAQEPQPDPRPARDPAAPSLGPGFDTVRLEPDGTGLVAGRAEPGALVSVLAGDEAVAEVEADAEGRFVAFLSLPALEAPRALSLRDEAGRPSEETVILAPIVMPPAEDSELAAAEPSTDAIAALKPRPATPTTGPAAGLALAGPDPSAAAATPEPGPPASDPMPAAVATVAALEPRPAGPTPEPGASPAGIATPGPDAPGPGQTESADASFGSAGPAVGEAGALATVVPEIADAPTTAAMADQVPSSPEPPVVESPAVSAPSEIEPGGPATEASSTNPPEPPSADRSEPEPTRSLPGTADEPVIASAPSATELAMPAPEADPTGSPASDRTAGAEPPSADPSLSAEASPSAAEPVVNAVLEEPGPASSAEPADAREPPATTALAPALEADAVDPDAGLALPGSDAAGAGPTSDAPVAAPLPDQAPSASLPPVVAGSAPTLDAPEPPQPPGQAPVLLSDAQGVRLLQPALPSGAGPEVLATVALDAIAYDGAGEVVLSGRGNGGTVRLYLDNEPAGEAAIGEDGQWMASLPDAEPGVYTLRLDQIDGAGEVVSRIETPFQREERASLQSAMADAQGAGQTIAVRVVQPGHTLWAIARDRYGEPLMYVRVFEANRDRIRDPDLIYPGQVFVLPDTEGP